MSPEQTGRKPSGGGHSSPQAARHLCVCVESTSRGKRCQWRGQSPIRRQARRVECTLESWTAENNKDDGWLMFASNAVGVGHNTCARCVDLRHDSLFSTHGEQPVHDGLQEANVVRVLEICVCVSGMGCSCIDKCAGTYGLETSRYRDGDRGTWTARMRTRVSARDGQH